MLRCLSSLTRGDISERMTLIFKVNDVTNKNYLDQSEFINFLDDLIGEINRLLGDDEL